MTDEPRLTTAQAAARLGVKPETVYAYVSRGRIERHRSPGGVSTFAARDVERLARNGRRTRRLPALVFPSALTSIADGRLTYRGVDAVEAATEHRFEAVAEWLWVGEWPGATRWPIDGEALDRVQAAQRAVRDDALTIERFRVIVATAGIGSSTRSADAAAVTARRLLRLLVHGLPRADHRAGRRAEPARSVAEVLWTRLTRLPRTPGRVAVLDLTLGLLADHELASSTLAARLAAMVRADVSEVVGAGLNVLGGLRHGGASLDLESLFRQAAREGADRALDVHVAARSTVEGFGHPLYPSGDPRARAVLDRLADLDPPGDRLDAVDEVLTAARRRGLPPPNIDVALAALAFGADMARGAGEAIFALARSAGWIAHAIEQYGEPTFMRARVDYTGPAPEPRRA